MARDDVDRRQELIADVAACAPELEAGAIEAHLALMGDEYAERHDAAALGRHVSLAARLEPGRPLVSGFRARPEGDFEVTFVGSDIFGEFALLSGLLAAYGLDIRSGHVHTSQPPLSSGPDGARDGGRPRRARGEARVTTRIVDTFVVRPAGDVVMGPALEADLTDEAARLVGLAGEGALPEARDRLNRRLAERLEFAHAEGILLPVDVRFDNSTSSRWTVMEVAAQDTPAFLYALANALSLRGVYIHSVEIGTEGAVVHDRFQVAHREGGQITSADDLAALRMTVGLIKQFTHFLPSAPDPARALRAFDQLVDRFLDAGQSQTDPGFFAPQGLDMLAQVLGSSRFLWEDFLRMQFENLAPLVGPLREEPLPRGQALFRHGLDRAMEQAGSDPVARKAALNAEKDRSLFAIDLKRLVDPSVSLAEFSLALTELVEAVLDVALEECEASLIGRHGVPRLESGAPCPIAICGLGKLGGRELGYASDIELLLAYSGPGRTDGPESVENAVYYDAFARALTDMIEARQHGIFEIDLRLRPYGRKGPLASALPDLARYYSAEGDAAPFERQAFVKLRCVAGEASLGREVEAVRDRFVYEGPGWDRENALHLRGRQLRELVRPGEVNVKLGAGGLIDIEYAVQYLQIQHGAAHPELRVTGTLEALSCLSRCGLVAGEDYRTLSEAYVFLRRVIDGLRMVRGDAKDLVLPGEGSDALTFLARRLGVRGGSWLEAGRALAAEVRRHMRAAHDFYVREFGQP